jgi:hypothetical protein
MKRQELEPVRHSDFCFRMSPALPQDQKQWVGALSHRVDHLDYNNNNTSQVY